MENRTKLMVGVIAVLAVFLITVSNTVAKENSLIPKDRLQDVYLESSETLNTFYKVEESSFWYILLYKLGLKNDLVVNDSKNDHVESGNKVKEDDNVVLPVPGIGRFTTSQD